MSGAYTVKQIIDYMNLDTRDMEVNDNFKILGIYDQNFEINVEKYSYVENLLENFPNDLIFLTADNKLISQTERIAADSGISPSGTSLSANRGGAPLRNRNLPALITETRVPLIKLSEILDSHSIEVKEDLIRATLEDYVSTIPKHSEPYLNGEVMIYYFKDIEQSIKNLVAAGTLILDAVLYVSYSGVEGNQVIFRKMELTDDHFDPKLAVERISNSHKAIKAAFTTIYNQGYLPNEGGGDRGLSNFVKTTLFNDSTMTIPRLARLLSTANTMKFPAQIFLKIDIDKLPTDVASRCKMSIAGNRVLRYAVLAKSHERAVMPNLMGVTDPVLLNRLNKEYRKWELSIAIVDFLCSVSIDWRAQIKMHPLSPNRPIVKNYTLKLTHAVLCSLSQVGRNFMRAKINSEKIEAFKKDENFYGKTDPSGNAVYEILTNPEADFSDLTLETVKRGYGMA